MEIHYQNDEIVEKINKFVCRCFQQSEYIFEYRMKPTLHSKNLDSSIHLSVGIDLQKKRIGFFTITIEITMGDSWTSAPLDILNVI